MDGILPINKPKGCTSHDVVDRVRRIVGTRRVGHAGTLDPLATGVLILCVGRATRVVPYLVGLAKEYTGEFVLGARSNTYDAQGEIEEVGDPSGVIAEEIAEAMEAGTGLIEQQPPPFSAVKHRGKRLYEYARKGEKVPDKTRTVWIETFELVRYLPPRALFLARVGSGTYVRSMVHDLGERLGCGAYLSELCRTSVGSFHVDQCANLEALEAEPEEALAAAMLSISEGLAHLPKLIVMPRSERRVKTGREFTLEDIMECPGPQPIAEPALVLSSRGEALAIYQAASAEEPYRPLRVLVAE